MEMISLMRPLQCVSLSVKSLRTLSSIHFTRVQRTHHSCADRQIHLDRMIHFHLTLFPNWSSRAEADLKSLVSEHVWEDGARRRDRDRSVPLPALNKHSNTSVKSNNFTINEIPICLQSISRWHFPHCKSALIKFLKCKNAWQRLKTSLGVNVPARGLWYLIFITTRPGQRKPEC